VKAGEGGITQIDLHSRAVLSRLHGGKALKRIEVNGEALVSWERRPDRAGRKRLQKVWRPHDQHSASEGRTQG
jgi:hypothetical protein